MKKLNWSKQACAVCALCAAAVIASPAQTFTSLVNFNGTDGFRPAGALVQGANGNFYGVTSWGGTSTNCTSTWGCGLVFEVTTGGVLSPLYNFCSQSNCTDGDGPADGLVLATDGNFYGTTEQGGTGSCNLSACGTVFRITPGGTLTTLYSFCSQTNCTDGSEPTARLVQGTDGNFYGTTLYGGENCGDCGTVFKITAAGNLTTLYGFCAQPGCADGYAPAAGLVQGTDGNFYGTTEAGGYSGCGIPEGCGTVFQITPAGTLTTLYTFCTQGYPCTDGGQPLSPLVQGIDGNFYGSTAIGGNYYQCDPPFDHGCGTLFNITPTGTLVTLHSFDGTDGEEPGGLVQGSDGNFYGPTSIGGTVNAFYCISGCGTVFQVTPGGVLTTLHFFDGTDGYVPNSLVQSTNGTFLGTTSSGGSIDDGTVFSITSGASPMVSLAPASLTFGQQQVGITSPAQTETVTNTGTANLTISTVAVSGANATDFAKSADSCSGATVAPNGTCTVSVTFTPSASGPRSASLNFTDNAPNSPQAVTLTGTGTVPVASISPVSLTFGNQNVGTTSPPKPVALSNTGNASLSITSIAVSANFGETNNCGNSIAPSGSCTINVTFSPTTAGSLSGTLTVTDNSNGISGSKQTVSLNGTGIAAGITFSPSSVSFGSQVIMTQSVAKTVTLTSTGTSDLNITGITVTGTNAGDFIETNDCPSSLAPGVMCTASLIFYPSILGKETASLTVTDNALNSPQNVSLSGSGVLPVVLKPTSLNFGNQAQHTTSAPKTITLTNNQDTILSITSVAVSGDFAQTNTCGVSIPPRATCTISISFTPKIVGKETETLTVTDFAFNSPQTASLSGTGVSQAVVSSASLTFAAQKVGTSSAPKNVTLTNNLSTALAISSITFTGADPADFAQTNTCSSSLAAKSHCTISVTFRPTATGSRTATLSVNDSANNSPQTVALTGTGT